MSQFPASWDTVAIGDVFEVQLGKMLSKKAKTGTSSYRYLGNKNVQWNRVDIDDLQEMDFSPAEREKFALRPGDLLVCEGGEVGRTAVWRGELENCYYQKALHRLRAKKGRVHPEFMLRFMRLAAERDMFAGLTSQTSIAHLTKEKLETLEMPLPPLPEQKRIAAILDKADAIRRKRQEAIRLTEELLRSAFLDMFGDPVTNPKGWEVKKLGEVFELKHGFAFKSQNFLDQGKYTVLTPGNFHEKGGFRDRGEKQRYHDDPVPEDYVLAQGDILVAMTEQAPGLLGSPILVPESGKFLHNQRLGKVVKKGKVDSRFIVGFMNADSVRETISDKATGTKVQHTSPGRIGAMLVGIPPYALQLKYGAYFDRLDAHLKQEHAQAVGAETLVGSLTQRAFSGKL